MPAGDRKVRSPLPPLKKMHVAEKGSGQATELFNSQQQSLWSWVSRGIPTMPSDVSGTANALILTPNLTPNNTIPNYLDYMPFAFEATATSTGPVTIDVTGGGSTLGAKPLYLLSAAGVVTPAGANTLRIGNFYIAYYVQSLNGGDGGFILTAPASSGGGATWSVIYSQPITTTTLSITFPNLSQYSELWLICDTCTNNNTQRVITIQVSSDNGSTFRGDNIYAWTAFSNNAVSASAIQVGDVTTASGWDAMCRMSAFNLAAPTPFIASGLPILANGGSLGNGGVEGFIRPATAWNAFRLGTSGSFTAGNITLLGQIG